MPCWIGTGGAIRLALTDVRDASEVALANRLAAGDARSLAGLHHRFGHMISTLMLRLEPEMSPDVADELTREVFLRLLERAARRGRGGPIHDQLRGLVIAQTRRWRLASWLPSRFEPGAIRTASEQDDEDDRPPAPPDSATRLSAVFSGLPRSRRELLILNVVEGMSVRAMARSLGRRPGGVRRALRASRGALWATRSTAQIPPRTGKDCAVWDTFIDGDLPGPEAAAFQSHSRECDHCGPATLEWWRLHRELKSAAEDRAARRPSPAQSREIAAMLLGRAFERKRARLRVRLVAAAALLIGVGGAWVWLSGVLG